MRRFLADFGAPPKNWGIFKNYLFLNVSITENAKPGNVEIDFYRANTIVERQDFILKDRLDGAEDVKGFSTEDVMYLITPDRYANGDLNNDNTLNVLDVVLMVNIILDDSTYLPDADLNLDGSINVLDIINLINLILDRWFYSLKIL